MHHANGNSEQGTVFKIRPLETDEGGAIFQRQARSSSVDRIRPSDNQYEYVGERDDAQSYVDFSSSFSVSSPPLPGPGGPPPKKERKNQSAADYVLKAQTFWW